MTFMMREQTKEAKYLYCIVKCGEERSFNGMPAIGSGSDGIYTVAFEDLACVVSDSPDMKYDSTRANMMAHETVIERVMKELTVLPVRFGTVTRKDTDSPVEDIRHKLLENRYKEFQSLHEEMNNTGSCASSVIPLKVSPLRRHTLTGCTWEKW